MLRLDFWSPVRNGIDHDDPAVSRDGFPTCTFVISHALSVVRIRVPLVPRLLLIWLLLFGTLVSETGAFYVPRPPHWGKTQASMAMNKYINQFLGKDEAPSDPNAYTLSIGLGSNHELAIELESLQRSILYHCPILVHSCVLPAALHMPLLQLETSGPIQEVYKKLDETLLSAWNGTELFLQFQGLHVEGGAFSEHQVLSAGVQLKESSNNDSQDTCSFSFNDFCRMLKETIEAMPSVSHVSYPVYPSNSNADDGAGSEESFRPRVPFMRLPFDWNAILEAEHNRTCDSEEFLTSDQGGNGIAPIFWIQYMQDTFGEPQRLQTLQLTQSTTTLPCWEFQLPGVTTESERYWNQYAEQRLHDQTHAYETGDEYVDKVLLNKTAERLESLYSENENDEYTDNGGEESQAVANDFIDVSTESITDPDSDITVDEKDGVKESWEDIQGELLQDPQRSTNAPLDDWTQTRIQRTIAMRRKQLETKKDMPDIRDNKVFAKYKNGTLTPNQQVDDTSLSSCSSASGGKKLLDRSACVGFWKIIGSPTGFAVEVDTPSTTDNLVLRVDGTIAGGPILDQTTRQKASGGTWSLLKNDESNNKELRIRLVIPPKKDRILVMQGRVGYLNDQLPTMASNTFQIPLLEQKKESNLYDSEDAITCSGTVWLEDAVTKRNKQEIGTFSIMKLNTSKDPSDFTISIPRNVRNAD